MYKKVNYKGFTLLTSVSDGVVNFEITSGGIRGYHNRYDESDSVIPDGVSAFKDAVDTLGEEYPINEYSVREVVTRMDKIKIGIAYRDGYAEIQHEMVVSRDGSCVIKTKGASIGVWLEKTPRTGEFEAAALAVAYEGPVTYESCHRLVDKLPIR